MLPRVHRVTTGEQFRAAIRHGSRSGARLLVVHLAVDGSDRPPTVGVVVSKAVGNAVTRNQVKRRLRHLAAHRLDLLPAGAVVVVRAHPDAARATSAELGADLDQALSRCLAKAAR